MIVVSIFTWRAGEIGECGCRVRRGASSSQRVVVPYLPSSVIFSPRVKIEPSLQNIKVK